MIDSDDVGLLVNSAQGSAVNEFTGEMEKSAYKNYE
jgi:hypothetical protein